MSGPRIEDVEVRDPAAWEAELTRIRGINALHFSQLSEYPDGVGPTLIQYIAYFAVNAQQRIANGEDLQDFARGLMKQTEITVAHLGNQGVYGLCDLLGRHWVHGEAISEWYERGLE